MKFVFDQANWNNMEQHLIAEGIVKPESAREFIEQNIQRCIQNNRPAEGGLYIIHQGTGFFVGAPALDVETDQPSLDIDCDWIKDASGASAKTVNIDFWHYA